MCVCVCGGGGWSLRFDIFQFDNKISIIINKRKHIYIQDDE